MKKILFPLTAILMGFSVIAQNGTTLKLNLEKNKVYRLKSSAEQTISQTMNGVPQNTNVTSTSVVSIKMMDASADFLVTEFRFDTLVTVTNAMGKVVNINSANEGDIKSTESGEVMTVIMNRLSKNPLYVKMDYTGQIIELVNAKMLSDILLKDTALITGESAPVLKMQIVNQTSKKALISMAEAFTHNLPGKSVTTGDKWDITENMNAGGMSLDIISSYNLEGLKDNAANLTADMTIQASPNAEPLSYGPAKVSYDELKGMGKSEVVLDTRTGLLTQSTSKTHLAGNLNISVQGMNIQMPMEMDGTSKIISLQ
jgi:hypothetical protein